MDELLRVYARLDALRKNLPSRFSVEDKYVKEYHDILDVLSKLTRSTLDEFRVPLEEIKPTMTSSNYLTHENTYSRKNYCDRPMLLSKLDALLSYFEIKYLSPDKQEIGFKSK